MNADLLLAIILDQFNRDSEVKGYIQDDTIRFYRGQERLTEFPVELITAVKFDMYDDCIELALNGWTGVKITKDNIEWT